MTKARKRNKKKKNAKTALGSSSTTLKSPKTNSSVNLQKAPKSRPDKTATKTAHRRPAPSRTKEKRQRRQRRTGLWTKILRHQFMQQEGLELPWFYQRLVNFSSIFAFLAVTTTVGLLAWQANPVYDRISAFDNLPLFSGEDDYEFYQDLDFYLWLEKQSHE